MLRSDAIFRASTPRNPLGVRLPADTLGLILRGVSARERILYPGGRQLALKPLNSNEKRGFPVREYSLMRPLKCGRNGKLHR